MTMERVAVIDMGSNSFRLVVFQYEPDSWWSLADEIREPTRISAGMGDADVLQPEPMERALHSAAVFSSFLRASGVERVDAVATSAIRDAANRDELLAALHERTGLKVRVISGAEEARYGYLAIVNSLTLSEGFGIDLGGGSVQLMRIEDRRLEEAESVPLGSVRVSEAFLEGEKTSGKQVKKLRKHVGQTLAELEWWSGGESRHLAGIGGAIRNLATAAQKSLDLPDVDVQGFVLTRERLEELIDLLASKPVAKRGSVPGIKPDRGDVILGGALVLAGAMEHGGSTPWRSSRPVCARESSSSACSSAAGQLGRHSGARRPRTMPDPAPVIDGDPQSDPSAAIQRNSDLLTEAIGKPVEIVGPDP